MIRMINLPGTAPRTATDNWWRGLAIGLFGAVFLIFGSVLDARKPVKPPPDPPADYEMGTLYMWYYGGMGVSRDPCWVARMDANGANLSLLFSIKSEFHAYNSITPSKNLHNGNRLFACFKTHTHGYNEYGDQFASYNAVSGEALATSIVLVDETVDGNEVLEVIPPETFAVDASIPLVWYSDDRKLAFWAWLIERVDPDDTIPPFVVSVDPYSIGIYEVEIFYDQNGNPVAGPPVLIPWTNSLAEFQILEYWDLELNDVIPYLYSHARVQSFDIKESLEGPDKIYMSYWPEYLGGGTSWDPSLCVADYNVETSTPVVISDLDFSNVKINPDQSTIAGSEGGEILMYQIDSDPVAISHISHKRMRYGRHGWSPSGDNIYFSQHRFTDFYGAIARATADGKDVTVLWSGSPHETGFFIGWREASP